METQHTTEHTCITCPALHRDGENNRPHPNTYTHQHSCTECRTQIHGILNRIPHHHNDLDATPTNTSQPEHNIARTQDTPLGIRIAVLDELHTGPTIATANPPIPTGPDQEGTLPTTRILQHIAHTWLTTRQTTHPWDTPPKHHTIKNLTDWLTNRLNWALDTLPNLTPTHTAYLHALDKRLDHLNGGGTHRPTPIDGVPCRECNRYSLIRHSDTITCTAHDCRCRMSPDEYTRWTKLAAAHAQQDHQKAA
jgi:hypothetical protein